MRRITAVLLCTVFCVIFCGCAAHNNDERVALIRIHVRANSNDGGDQAVKLSVRDAVTALMEERLDGVDDYPTAYEAISEMLEEVESVATQTLRENGYDYGARARLNNEYFPTRSYGDIIVESGYYDALILELGEGAGDNWWCVIYPPLCFAGNGGEFKYRSLIKEIWDKYLKKQEE